MHLQNNTALMAGGKVRPKEDYAIVATRFNRDILNT